MIRNNMLLKLIFLVSVAIVSVCSFQEQKELEGAKAYMVLPLTKNHFNLLNSLEEAIDGVDILQHAHVQGREAQVVVLKHAQKSFEALLKLTGLPFEVYIEDVKAVAEKEMRVNEQSRLLRQSRNSKIDFVSYQRYADINAYLDQLAIDFPNTVTVIDSGLSYEGRIIKSILISTTGGTDTTKPVFIADGGNHAREWASPAQALYMIKKLVEEITESDVVQNMDWVIIPLLNPDGYEHSHTTYRLWRKTRSLVSSTLCPGVDGNRNFDFQWMQSGSSNQPCSDIFAGPTAFSESETRVLRDIVNQYQGRAKAYLAIHSYGSYFLYPYGYNGLPTPDNEELHNLGLQIAAVIDAAAVSGSTPYLVGNSGAALNYLAAGASDDWTYAVGNIKLSYTLELPGGGTWGFDLPPARIQQVVEETWQGILVMARYTIEQNRK